MGPRSAAVRATAGRVLRLVLGGAALAVAVGRIVAGVDPAATVAWRERVRRPFRGPAQILLVDDSRASGPGPETPA